MTTAATQTVSARVVKAITTTTRDNMEVGRVWVEVYRPFDPVKYAEFMRLVQANGGGDDGIRAAAEADPELAELALSPIDAHGEAMIAPDLEALADGYLKQSRLVDVGHDEISRDTVAIVGSFLNTPEIASPHYFPGAWVVVLQVDETSPEFAQIKAGTLNAVSFQAYVKKLTIVWQQTPAADAQPAPTPPGA